MDNNNKALLAAVAVVVMFFALNSQMHFLGAVTGTATYSSESAATAEMSVTTPAGQTYNNGIIEGTEVCDGTNFGTKTCMTEGYSGGTLTCVPPGNLAFTECTTTCGATHTAGEVVSTQCADGDVQRTTWSCDGTVWKKVNATYIDCTSQQTCSNADCVSTSPLGGGGGGGGGSTQTGGVGVQTGVQTGTTAGTAVDETIQENPTIIERWTNLDIKLRVLIIIGVIYLLYAYMERQPPFKRR